MAGGAGLDDGVRASFDFDTASGSEKWRAAGGDELSFVRRRGRWGSDQVRKAVADADGPDGWTYVFCRLALLDDGKRLFFFRADRQRSRVGSGLREGEERQVQCPSRDGTAASPRIGIGKKTGPDQRTISGRQGTRGEGWRSWDHLEPWPTATGTRAEPAAGSHQPCSVGSCWSRKENSPAAQVGGRTILTFCTQQKESGSRLWALLFSKFLLLGPGWNRAQFSLVQKAPRRAASASRSSHHLFSAPAAPARARLAEKDHHLSQVQPQFLCGKDSWRFDLCLCLHIICSDADGTGRVWGGQPRACCLLPEILRGCYPPLRRTLRIRIPPRRCRRRLIFHRRQTGTETPRKTRASQIFTQTPHACSWRRDRYDQFLEKRLFFSHCRVWPARRVDEGPHPDQQA